MNLTLNNLPIIGKILNKLDLVAKNEGLVAVMRTIMTNVDDKSIVKNKTEGLKKILINEPVLVICNHPAQSDVPILISTLEPRKDIYIVLSHHFMNILPSTNKNAIPVYLSHEGKRNDLKFRLLKRLNPVNIPNNQEAHQINIKNINNAAEKINKGAMVIIYPAAFGNNYDFKTGVGYIIKNIKSPEKVSLVMAHIKGSSGKDYLRLIPFINKLMPNITIYFQNGGKVSEYKKADPQKTTIKLQEKYYQWAEELK